MKEITLFTDSEKKVMQPLLKAKELGNHEAAVRFTEMFTEGCKRAVAEYKKHPMSEEVISNFPEDDEFWTETVADKIAELEEKITKNEKWLRSNRC